VLPSIDIELLHDLLPSAILLGLISFILSVSVAATFATQYGYNIDPNQGRYDRVKHISPIAYGLLLSIPTEFIALGLANIAGAFCQAFPISGKLQITMKGNLT